MLEELKTKSGKNLFRKLNEYSKNLQEQQGGIIKKHNSLAAQYDELKHLKVNMDSYLGRDKTNEKKEFLRKRIKYRKRLRDDNVLNKAICLIFFLKRKSHKKYFDVTIDITSWTCYYCLIDEITTVTSNKNN